MKKTITIMLLTVFLFSFQKRNEVSETIKFKMFCSALNNFSTAPNYIVIKVKNKNSEEVKEVCTETGSLFYAIYIETKIKKWDTCCSNYLDRYFEFSKDSALNTIGFYLYSKRDLENYAKTLEIADLVDQIKKGELRSKEFMGFKSKEQIMFAHLMFNNGVMVKHGCITGDICYLSYFLDH